MAASSAIIGKGTTLGYSVVDADSYTTIAELFSVGIPDTEVDEVEVTHYASDNDFKEFVAGWEDGGEVEFELNYEKDEADALIALRGAPMDWKITLPDTSTWIFPGFIKKLGGEIPNQDKVTTKATIRITGVPDFTPAV